MSPARSFAGQDALRSVARTIGPAAVVVAIQLIWFPMPVGGVISGIILGLLGALGAVGIALIWRANRVINFAQGDLGAFPATLAVLLITHDVEEAIYMADRVMVLSPRPATIQASFTVDLPHPRRLGSPQAQALREAILKELGL